MASTPIRSFGMNNQFAPQKSDDQSTSSSSIEVDDADLPTNSVRLPPDLGSKEHLKRIGKQMDRFGQQKETAADKQYKSMMKAQKDCEDTINAPKDAALEIASGAALSFGAKAVAGPIAGAALGWAAKKVTEPALKAVKDATRLKCGPEPTKPPKEDMFKEIYQDIYGEEGSES